MARRDQAERQRRVSGDVPVRSRGNLGGGHLILRAEHLRRLSVDVPRLQGVRVRLDVLGFLRKFLREPFQRRLHRPGVEPVQESQREEILAPLLFLVRELEAFERLQRQGRYPDLVGLVAGQRSVLQRVGVVSRLLQFALLERVGVDDDDAVLRHAGQIGPQRRRVEGDEHIRLISGRVDILRGELDLEPRHAGKRARRRADLGGKIRERRKVVADDGARVRELSSGDLHAIAGVPGESDRDSFQDGFTV